MDISHYILARPTAARLCYAQRMAAPKNLVECWLAAEHTSGKNRAEALRNLNKACGTRYAANRTYEWQHGVRELPPKPRAYMIRMALRYILALSGLDSERLSPSDLKRLVDRLA